MVELEFGERMFLGIYTADVQAENGNDRQYCLSTGNPDDRIRFGTADELASTLVSSLEYEDDAEYLLEESQSSLEALEAALGERGVEYDIEQAAEDGLVPFDSFYQTPRNEAPELHSRWEEGQYREMEMTEKMAFLQNVRERLEFEYGDLLEEQSPDE